MELNIANIFFASRQLTDMANTYGTINELISAMGYQDAFESPEAQEAWNNAHESIWSHIATAHDNLHEAAAALIIYINAMCAQDEDNADQLKTELDAFETEYEAIESEYGFGVYDGDIPGVNPDDRQDGILDVPEYEDAKRPRGNND